MKTIGTKALMSALLVGAFGASAANTTVGFQKAPIILTSGSTTTAGCPVTDGLPSDYVPAFHFDASQRTGWSYCGDGSVVWQIPSLVGNRYLTTNETDMSSWRTGWGYGRFPKGAVLVQNVENSGVKGPYLDFGAYGSQRGLFFNPDSEHLDDGGYPLNDIVGIGTVVAVVDTSDGGGYLLGGGWKWSGNGSTMNVAGTVFGRGTASVDDHPYASAFTPYQYSSLGASAAFWQDGLWPKGTYLAGYSGGWEIVSVVASKTDIPATGVGIGRTTTDPKYSGGLKIAEMLIYTNKLDAAAQEKAAAYLRKKWFGDSLAGHDGHAEAGVFRVSHNHYDGTSPRIGGSVSATVSVPSGATIAVDRIDGGRKGGTLTVSGGGTLSIRAANTYGGKVRLSGGCALGLAPRAVPSSLPTGSVLHLDASDATTLTTEEVDGVSRVSGWSSTGGAVYSVAAIDGASRPVLRGGQFANGKPCVDFGSFGSGYMMRVKKNGSDSNVNVVQSILYVADMQDGGGTVFGSVDQGWTAAYAYMLDRGSNTNGFDKGIFYTSASINQICATANPYSGIIYLNGERADGAKGFAAPAWQTFAANVPGGRIYTIGGTFWSSYPARGGFRLAELVVYDRILAPRELEDASAYLANKWFGKVEAGYVGATADGVADVDSVSAESDADVSVSSESVRIRSLSSAAGITKTGAGRIDVQTAAVTSLVVSAGTVRAVPEPDVASPAVLAHGASLHLDATDTNHMETVVADGKNFVGVWRDADDPRRAIYAASRNGSPWINATDMCNGLPVVDFGAYGTQGEGSGRYMYFAKPLDNIRSVFMVARFDPDGYAPFLGYSPKDPSTATTYNAPMDFTRHQRSSDTGKSMFLANAYSAVVGAEIRTNGVSGVATSFQPCGDYMLIEVHPASGAYASGLCYESGADSAAQAEKMLGGLRVGELVVYERVLSEREKTATRNYLMRKWLGVPDGELEPLPECGASVFSVGSISVAAGAAFETAPGAVLDGNLSYADGACVRLTISEGASGEPSIECVSVNGSLSFGNNVTVDVVSPFSPEALKGRRFTVFKADRIINAGQFNSLRLPPPYDSQGYFAVKDNRIDVVFKPRGAIIMFY